MRYSSPMDDAFTHCEALVRTADKDRYLASLFAPARSRRALFALYAFNIEVTRVREVARERFAAEVRLQWWRDALAGPGHGDVRANPVAAALLETVVRYRLGPVTLTEMVEARFFDLYDDPMGTLAEFDGYAAKTSSALIGLAAQVLNDGRDPGVGELTYHAGSAHAIAGLLLAFPIHAARGQLYIPLEVLERHGARPDDIFAGRVTTELRAALAEMRLRARAHLDSARDLLATVPEAILPALLPAAPVRVALDRMEKASYRPFAVVEPTQWRRQWLMWRAARRPGRMFR